MRTHISVSILGAAAVMLLTGCTVKDIDAPALAGPSTLATSITMRATPDTLLQDGASQSVITITAVDPEGRPKTIPLRADISVDGVDPGLRPVEHQAADGQRRAADLYGAADGEPGRGSGAFRSSRS